MGDNLAVKVRYRPCSLLKYSSRRHRITEKQITKNIDYVVYADTIIPLIQKIFVHFLDCGEGSVAMLYNIGVTKVLVSGKINQIKSTSLSC